jgi:hypothetical protein
MVVLREHYILSVLKLITVGKVSMYCQGLCTQTHDRYCFSVEHTFCQHMSFLTAVENVTVVVAS